MKNSYKYVFCIFNQKKTNRAKSSGKGKTRKIFGVKRIGRESRDVIFGITKHPLED